jgi:hypothetical protein
MVTEVAAELIVVDVPLEFRVDRCLGGRLMVAAKCAAR